MPTIPNQHRYQPSILSIDVSLQNVNSIHMPTFNTQILTFNTQHIIQPSKLNSNNNNDNNTKTCIALSS